MKLPSPAIGVIQRAIEVSLQLDPALKKHVFKLDQKVVRFQILGLDADIYLMFVDGEVQVSAYFDGEADTMISGTPFALAGLSRDFQGIFSGDVTIDGDLSVGRRINQLLAHLDIDWEQVLSPLVGGSAAHQLGRVHREIMEYISSTVEHFQHDAAEYMTEESNAVVGKNELSDYLSGVDLLREDTDRLIARLDVLCNQAERKGK